MVPSPWVGQHERSYVELWPLDSNLLLMDIVPKFFAYLKKSITLPQVVTTLVFIWISRCINVFPYNYTRTSNLKYLFIYFRSFWATFLLGDKTVSDLILDFSHDLVWILITTGKAIPLKGIIYRIFQLFH